MHTPARLGSKPNLVFRTLVPSSVAEEGQAQLPHGYERVGEMALGQILEVMARPHFDESDIASVRETVTIAADVWNVSRMEPDQHIDALGQIVWNLQNAGVPVQEAADFVFDLYEGACLFPGDERRVDKVEVTMIPDVGLAVLVQVARYHQR